MTDLVALVRTFYDDNSTLFATLADDVEWHETEGMPYGGVYRGVDAVMAGVFRHVFSEWEGFGATPEAVFPAGDNQVLSIGRYQGVFKATGKRMNAAFAHLYTFRDDKVVTFRQFGDSAAFRAAMT